MRKLQQLQQQMQTQQPSSQRAPPTRRHTSGSQDLPQRHTSGSQGRERRRPSANAVGFVEALDYRVDVEAGVTSLHVAYHSLGSNGCLVSSRCERIVLARFNSAQCSIEVDGCVC